MTEQLLAQQLESPSGTGRVEPEVKPACQLPTPTNRMPTGTPILTGSSERLLGPPERAGRRRGHPRGQTSSMMTDAVRWMEAVRQQLPVQGELVGGLVRIVERTADFFALIVSCSLGRGNADEFSDVDAAITHTMTDVGRLEVAANRPGCGAG